MQTGQVINKRYLLQHIIRQGYDCAVYQAFDQILQRIVAVKVPLSEHISAYRFAVRATSQFTHPHIVGTYDLIVEPEALYIVQEFVDGNTFEALLQAQLTPYEVAEFGLQICQALLYAGSPSHRMCHGDLTPNSVIRDRRGLVHVNNFALPSDTTYFSHWSHIGGGNQVISDHELPWGKMTEARRADDTRAVGLLLYQLLAGRAPGTTTIEPPTDGRLRFRRNIPVELCQVIARTVAHQHPQYIATPEILLIELKALTETLQPPPPVSAPISTESTPLLEDMPEMQQTSPVNAGKLALSLPMRTAVAQGGASPFQSQVPSQSLPKDSASSPFTIADVPMQGAHMWQAPYSPGTSGEPSRLNIPLVVGLGIIVFVLFFVVGFFLVGLLFH